MLSGASLLARTIMTPLPEYFSPYHYYGYYPYDMNTDKCWYIDIWGEGYFRNANDAFGNCGEREHIPFTQLIFGQPSFTVAQAFADASVDLALPLNPFVAISTITPRFDYKERGAFFHTQMGMQFCDERLHIGWRARLPIRDIEVEEICADNNLIGETLNEVFALRQEDISVDGTLGSNTAWAARLDFLSAINRIAVTTTGGSDPMVIYNDPQNQNRLSIGGQDVSSGVPAAGPVPTNVPIVAVIESDNGALPQSVRWANVNTSITGVVAADGSGLANLQRGRFASDINYASLGGSQPAQSRLFVVPTVDDSGAAIGSTTGGSNQILAAILAAENNLAESVTEFFDQVGLDFCDGRSKGLGDLDLELYLGYIWGCNRRWWNETQFGVRFPTSDKLCNCLHVLKQPLGNDGHFEVRVGETIGWDAHDRVKLKLWGTYNWVLSKTEQIAAPFAGATVKNIGPCIPAKVKWDYFLGTFDITFFASDCCGFMAQYEAYHKRCDRVALCQDTAIDFAGRVEPLDTSVITNNTSRTSHKIRTEFFLRTYDCEIYTGYDYTVAGKNISRDTDYYLGLIVHF